MVRTETLLRRVSIGSYASHNSVCAIVPGNGVPDHSTAAGAGTISTISCHLPNDCSHLRIHGHPDSFDA